MEELSLKEKNPLVLDFDAEVYSLAAIKYAAYDFGDRAGFQIELIPSGKIRVLMTPKSDSSQPLHCLVAQFRNHSLDHQIRVDINHECRAIREMIMAQAFSPCDNLREVIDALRL
jgi:His-Xaa-Ser system protein HxsD